MKRLKLPLFYLFFLLPVLAGGQPSAVYPGPGKLSRTSGIYLDALRRWEQSLPAGRNVPGLPDSLVSQIGSKCIFTLLNNRQEPGGGLKHEGVMPSYSGFPGFWAWDSWKHAFALAGIEPELAKNNMRAMFDYQDSCGMVADCIFPDTAENNYRDTKPPLAAWALKRIFDKTSDTAFVREMFPRLMKYHRWWYTHRDHDGNGLCEYGSTDGSIQAARWESGWDNAVRFDSARMLKNNDHAWSMDQESCDLNAYLFVEKYCLSSLAATCGDMKLSLDLFNEAKILADKISRLMWDDRTGFFYDIKLFTKQHVKVAEPNGWIPLWAGIASTDQARRISLHITNVEEFNSFVPFPTVALNNPSFDPSKGYWRGPVWLDQAYFALKGLRDYGYLKEADSLLLKLVMNCEGLADRTSSIRENYDPLTGRGLNASDFSWSAAHVLMMLEDAMTNHSKQPEKK